MESPALNTSSCDAVDTKHRRVFEQRLHKNFWKGWTEDYEIPVY